MKLLLVCLYAICALAFSNAMDLEFRKSGETENINRFETIDLASNDKALEKRAVGDTCQSGYQASKYCTTSAKNCFGNSGQNVYIRFKPAFKKAPKVVIGLTLVDAISSENVRVRAKVISVSARGFTVQFRPWDKSTTYQIGVNWMACP